MSDELEARREVGQGDDNLDAKKLPWKSKDSNGPPCATLPVEVDSDDYCMKHKSRGKCLIFNNKVFDPHTRLNERRGTDADAISLYHCFRELDFDVILHHNATKMEITGELKKVASEDHSDNDCFVCVVLTHGDQGVLFGRDGKFPTDWIFAPFLGDVCTTLAGKPKMFFIQACQGDRLDSGTLLKSKEGHDGNQVHRIPTYADFLITYSTVPGFYSWRNTTRGSWFIQALCYVIKKQAKDKDLLEMLTVVNRRVAYDFESCTPDDPSMHEKKQVPCVTSMLTRKIYFFSKSY